MTTVYASARPPSEAAERVEILLREYPTLNEKQLEELIDLYPSLTLLEQSLLTTNDHIATQLAVFQKTHRKDWSNDKAGLVFLMGFPVFVILFAMLGMFR